MDELRLKDKKFISSKRVAQLTGYTTDYVGQLCRAEKIEGVLVGRNWYVDENSVMKHKQSYKKQQKVVKKLSEYAYEPLSYTDDKVTPSMCYKRAALVHYTHDNRLLNPEPTKARSGYVKSFQIQPSAQKNNTSHVNENVYSRYVSRFIYVLSVIFVIFGTLSVFFVEKKIVYSSTSFKLVETTIVQLPLAGFLSAF